MMDINHPNIMHLYHFLESSNNYYLILQYCNRGDLEHYVNKQPGQFLPEKEAIYFLKQMMNGFQVLRKHEVMHRDFKLSNVMLNGETLVIGDFGFAKSGYEMAQTNLGTPLTKAPELRKGVRGFVTRTSTHRRLTFGRSELSSIRCFMANTPSSV
jgi:serine/threonine protein kinase